MLAFPAMPAGVIGILFYNLVMTSYFLGYGGRILANLLGDMLERHAVPETGFNDDSFAEG